MNEGSLNSKNKKPSLPDGKLEVGDQTRGSFQGDQVNVGDQNGKSAQENEDADESFEDVEDQSISSLQEDPSRNQKKPLTFKEDLMNRLFDDVVSIVSEGDSIDGEGWDEYEYFDYEAELQRQERAFMEKYGIPMTNEGAPLTSHLIALGLSDIGKPVDTTELAYMTFEACGKNLSDIEALSSCVHLTTVILSENKIQSLRPLSGMQFLKVLNAEINEIESIEEVPLGSFKWLQALNLSENKLQSMDYFRPNIIMYLNLAKNNLGSVEYFTNAYFPNLLSLELRRNRLTSIQGLELPKLRQLFIADNQINDLQGLNGAPMLERVHARYNNIKLITISPGLDKLEYINLRDNKIFQFTQTINLQNIANLNTLIVTGNPICGSKRYKNEMLAACISLKRLDKEVLSEMEILEGRVLRTGRLNGTLNPLDDDPEILDPDQRHSGEGDFEEMQGEENDEGNTGIN